MTIHQSNIQQIGAVTFPEHTGERVYMLPFDPHQPLPSSVDRWQHTVDAMLRGLDLSHTPRAYLMVDQGHVAAGNSHRRPGVHIDGYWVESLGGHHGGGHRARAGGTWHSGGGWSTSTFDEPEALILASDVCGARAYVGSWSGHIGDGGDCTAVDVSGLAVLPLRAGMVYAGNVTMLHESIPLYFDTKRTLVRINAPGVRLRG